MTSACSLPFPGTRSVEGTLDISCARGNGKFATEYAFCASLYIPVMIHPLCVAFSRMRALPSARYSLGHRESVASTSSTISTAYPQLVWSRSFCR
jgi:hypothetical protein